ncbi:CG15172 [Drosophila busckii]|uniref:CG15172 n=1 Tax=Drosophila busckii TaxID=30019 RepID=A0A0M5J1A7_DROBS|nr:uncharacterized protein LOC108603372 [Drosophila busckii]ALC38461.1 CG15172 [Drosophila busckii]
MCPNQGVERNLLPDPSIANRVFLYSMLYSLQAEDRRSDEVATELRDRYEVFRQVIHNYPMPLFSRMRNGYEYEYAMYDAMQLQPLTTTSSNTSMDNNPSDSSTSMSSLFSNSSCSSNLSERCDYYEDTVRSALAQLGGSHALAQDMQDELMLEGSVQRN